MFDRVKLAMGYPPPPEQPVGLLQQLQTDLGEATTLTWQQRMWAFGGAVLLTAIFWGLVRATACRTSAVRIRPQSRTT
jgi:hypothetical protein